MRKESSSLSTSRRSLALFPMRRRAYDTTRLDVVSPEP